jgi:ATP synthase protein I
VKGPVSPWKALSLVSIIGVNIAVSTLAGVWIGNKVDMYFNTSPWWMIGCLFLGMGSGFMSIIPIIKRFLGDQTDD